MIFKMKNDIAEIFLYSLKLSVLFF